MNLKPATEQREVTIRSAEKRIEHDLALIITDLDVASLRGEFEVAVRRDLLDETVRTLKSSGYDVTPVDEGWCISWWAN